MRISTTSRGMTLIDVLIGSALVLIIFMSLMSFLRASIAVSTLAQSRAGAVSLSESQMEYLRGLSYDSLGTIGGIPSGLVPPTQMEKLNNIPYTVHTYIQYVDSQADGIGVNDTNGITADYKVVKVSVDYEAGGLLRSSVVVSNFSPPSIETTNGGGTLTIHVVNATGAPVAGATVKIIDASTTPAINTSVFSNTSGTVSLPGAPPSTDYQIFVTKNGYSSAQTYVRDTTNQNPTPGYLTVVKDKITAGTFAIDTLASITLHTYKPIETRTFSDTFADQSLLSATSSVSVSSGKITLSNSSLSGFARSISVTPTLLRSWGKVETNIATTSSSNVLMHVYTSGNTLLPDSALPGNSVGFAVSPVDLSNVSTSTYKTLSIGAVLSRTSTSTTPKIYDWSLTYTVGPTPIPNVSLTLAGAKTIGSTGAGAPIYKTNVTQKTNSSGQTAFVLEWDSYSVGVGGYDVEDACPFLPYALAPASATTTSLMLTTKTTNRLLVNVQDSNGSTVPGANVKVTGTSYSKSAKASACADAYFGGLAIGKYTITLSKSGYTTTIINNVAVSGQTFYIAAFQ